MNKLKTKESRYLLMNANQRYNLKKNRVKNNLSTTELRLCDNMLYMSQTSGERNTSRCL